MRTVRQDAWSDAEDQLLAETVLSYIQSGRTQLEAFREISERLSRTKAACGFRWNALIRKQYENEIEKAKRIRKGGKTVKNPLQHEFLLEKTSVDGVHHSVGEGTVKSIVPATIDTIIEQLAEVKKQIVAIINSPVKESAKNKGNLEELQAKYDYLKTDYTRLKEDYETFIKNIDLLRQKSFRDQDGTPEVGKTN